MRLEILDSSQFMNVLIILDPKFYYKWFEIQCIIQKITSTDELTMLCQSTIVSSLSYLLYHIEKIIGYDLNTLINDI